MHQASIIMEQSIFTDTTVNLVQTTSSVTEMVKENHLVKLLLKLLCVIVAQNFY